MLLSPLLSYMLGGAERHTPTRTDIACTNTSMSRPGQMHSLRVHVHTSLQQQYLDMTCTETQYLVSRLLLVYSRHT